MKLAHNLIPPQADPSHDSGEFPKPPGMVEMKTKKLPTMELRWNVCVLEQKFRVETWAGDALHKVGEEWIEVPIYGGG